MRAAENIWALLKASCGRPRVHGNGFIQLDLTPSMRLHVFYDDVPRQNPPTPIHNHTFGFKSYVLGGAIENVMYEAHDDASGLYGEYVASVRAGEDTVLAPNGHRVSLTMLPPAVYVEGECYSMRPGQIHQSNPCGPVVTVIVKDAPSLSQGGLSPIVYVPRGIEPDNAFDRYAHGDIVLWALILRAFAEVVR
jgi:hypothetical protein